MTDPQDEDHSKDSKSSFAAGSTPPTDESLYDTEAIETQRNFIQRLRRRSADLITDAPHSPYENRRKREIIYLIIQFSRVPMVLIGAAAWYWWDLWWLFLLMFLLSIPAPGVSVVIANEKGQKRDRRQQAIYKPGLARQIEAQMELERQNAAQLEAGSAKQLGTGGSKSEPEHDPIVIDAEDDPQN